jgi:glycosyltransferase involved in cell wall biosynthesis
MGNTAHTQECLMPKLIVHATNVHCGGGGVLLKAILNNVPQNLRVIAQVDRRLEFDEKDAQRNLSIRRVNPTLNERFRAEKWLQRNVCAVDHVLCFGNLPPIFRLKGRVSLFVQNRFLLDECSLKAFPLRTRLRITIERYWLKRFLCNANEIVVQTKTMASMAADISRNHMLVRILPFAQQNDLALIKKNSLAHERCDFAYVADGEPHKNHKILLEAWRVLAEEGIYPFLILTFDPVRFADLNEVMKKYTLSYGLKIQNAGQLDHQGSLQLMRQANALIFPSEIESFGIPLIEARDLGVAILAPERDYVRDLLDPNETFDPASPVSIARAVKRYLSISELRPSLLEPKAFVTDLLGVAESEAMTGGAN